MENENKVAAKSQLEIVEQFQWKLNQEPSKSAIKNQRGVSYLPISYIEIKLDEFFLGLWKTSNVQTRIVANEIIVDLELHVYHPIMGIWITRVGCGASMIQQDSGASVTDIGAKKKNTIHKDFPSAKAEAVKNAAKSLGKIFGRDISRKVDTVSTFVPMIATKNRNLALAKAKKEANESK